MNKVSVFLVSLLSSLSFAQQEQADSTTTEAVPVVDERGVVKSILEQCGLNDLTVEDVVKFEDGKVVSLNLSNRDISKDGIDKIPADIGKLTALRTLEFSGNIITTLPPEIGNLSNLQKLDASSNRLDSLPADIGFLTNLTDLDLRHNRLTSLPPTIGKLINVVYLRLWGNRLESLTDAVTYMSSLKELYLKDNRLTTLPEGLMTMKSLTYIDFIGNRLCNLDPKLDEWVTKKDKQYKSSQKCW